MAGTGTRWGAGCCFLDYDRDGRLDLFVANYVNFDPAKAPRPGDAAYCRYNEIPVPCGPLGFAGGTNILYRNRGDGTFEDVSEASGIARPRGPSSMVFVTSDWRPVGSYGMGAASADFDNDGWPDIYVACDTAPSLLYRNNHDGTFREVAVGAGTAFDEHGVALAGMGVGVGDYDADGWLDIVRTNFSEQVTVLYRNYGGAFEDASIKAGLGVNRKYVGFGVDFFDFDNDGWSDIFVANGHVYSQIAGRKLHLSYRQPRLLYRNLGNGRFRDVSAEAGPAVTAENLGRGCAFGDFDNDGDVDVLINNLDGPPTLLRNDGGTRNNSILIKCVGTKSNRSGIGTRVKVTAGGRTQMDEVTSGSSYYSQNDFRLHFGLGALTRAEPSRSHGPRARRSVLRTSLPISCTSATNRRASSAAESSGSHELARFNPLARTRDRAPGSSWCVSRLCPGCSVHRRNADGGNLVRAPELCDAGQVPPRNDGRRRGPARLRQRRPSRRVLHQRREARRIDDRRQVTRQDRSSILEPALQADQRRNVRRRHHEGRRERRRAEPVRHGHCRR